MIIEPIKNGKIPKGFRPSQRARLDLGVHGDKINSLIMERSREMWGIWHHGKLLIVAGIVAPSLVGSVPELWLLVSEDFRARNAPEVRKRIMPELLKKYPRVHVIVDWSFTSGVKFAKFMGFRVVDTVRLDKLGFLKMEAHVVV